MVPKDARRIVARGTCQDSIEDPERLQLFPAAVDKLLRVDLSHAGRPPVELGRAFAGAL